MGLKVNIDYIPLINFAMQQNHAVVLREIKISNDSEDNLENISVSFSFDPDFGSIETLHIDILPAGAETRLSDIPLRISTSFLSNLTERITGQIKVTLATADTNLVTEICEIVLLSFDQWGGSAVLPEMLAAFVTPNYPVITPIIKRAAEILGVWTSSSALDEYQTRDPDRVKKQMAAVFESIAERQIAYCTVPASFENSGQRIRLYDDILSGGLATCLDMTLLYAGCLEAIGLHPILVLIEGHAFAGAWLVPESFPDSVNDDASLLTKRTAAGINEILLVETTCMNAGRDIPFDRAVEIADNHLCDLAKFHLFIDVLRARNAQIRPLPRRMVLDGMIGINEEPGLGHTSERPSDLSATHTVVEADRIEVNKQTIWERKLLDLSLRNSLLNTRITKNTLQLIAVKVDELEDALADGQEFQILPKPADWDNPLLSTGIYRALNATDPIVDLIKSELSQKRLHSYLTAESLQRSLTHIYRTSRLSLEENGANTLYLAVGFLRWFETPSSTRPRFAPILLLPIEIIRKSVAKGFVIRSRDEETMLNITLLEMLRQDFGIRIGGLDPLPCDESGVDVTLIFNTVRRAIMSQTGWDVEEQAIIGNFSFNKFIMWNDIHNNADKLSRNNIVSGLIAGRMTGPPDDCDMADTDLDSEYPAGDVALPIGADSSQFEAICAAVEEKSFILHGPPGTGKSQTITNIIANALYKGKKVLFVAEKMAALQVVRHRLEAIGLAPFCLELHSNKSKKSSVLEQLKRTTEVIKRKSNESFKIRAEQINALRSELNGYVHTLHRRRAAGISLYGCFARFAASQYSGSAVPVVRETLAAATPASMAAAEAVIADYQAICRVCGVPAQNPWAGTAVTEYSSAVRDELKTRIEKLADNLKIEAGLLATPASLLDTDISALNAERRKALNTIVDILLTARHIPAELLGSRQQAELCSGIDEASRTGLKRNELHDSILQYFDKSILSADINALEKRWVNCSAKWWLPRTLGQNKVKSQLRVFTRNRQKPSTEQVDTLFSLLGSYRQLQERLYRYGSELAPVLGTMWNIDDADWTAVAEAARAVRELTRSINRLTGDIAAAMRVRLALCHKLECGLDTFRDIYAAKLGSLLKTETIIAEATEQIQNTLKTGLLSESTTDEMPGTVSRWLRSIDRLHDWAAHNVQLEKVKDCGFAEFAAEVEAGNIAPDEIISAFTKSFYKAYAEYILAAEPGMNEFHGMLFEEKVERFRQLSREFELLTREELYAKLASSLPAFQKEAAQSSEVGILQRNIRNGGRGTSIRRLFDLIPDLLTRMCPCMLMSPISVAQYIDADGAPFDLVIFDEASQMPTCEAVGAIARGHNVIVVGDPQQMPPTSFFSTNNFDEDNADKEDMESILDDCLALQLPSKYLLWHYRSKHESLIAFSNIKFYENKLLTFPSPDDLATKVSLCHVEGIYDRGRTRQNRAEAEAVVAEIEKRLSDPATAAKSIGVVTFNTNQQSLIEYLLLDLLRRRPELEAIVTDSDEPVFIKNLENVQGDERDVILFSIGYGPDNDGRIALNFGPLNRDGGWRRLNVAVSRARYEMKVFSTLMADDIDLNRSSAKGVAELKAFLEYAEKGRQALCLESRAENVSADALRDSIAADLSARGYRLKTDVGCSGYKIDIGIINPDNPDKYLLGILCDGQHYNDARTAQDRVVTQNSVLRLLGWKLKRVWAMDWWENRERTVEAIVEAIENTSDDSPEPQSLRPDNYSSAVQPEAVSDTQDDESDNFTAQYNKALLDNTTISADTFISGSFDNEVIDRIKAVVQAEAPVSKTRLCKRVLNSFGISRMGPRLAAYMDSLLVRTGLTVTGDSAPFYWDYSQTPNEYRTYRPVSDREALDIAPEEISVAICRILDEQGSLPEDCLVREVTHTFNYARMGDNVVASINRAIDYALAASLIQKTNDRIKLA